MALQNTAFGDISPRTAAYAERQLLERAAPLLVLNNFGQSKPLPPNNTNAMIFRRYNALAPATVPLIEGVTPQGKKLTKTDVPVTLNQYGDYVELTDQVADLHTDNVLREAVGILGEQAALTVEMVGYGAVKAGTNVFYANGAARNAVNTRMTAALQGKVLRMLWRQLAKPISSVIKSSPSYGTEPVLPAYIGLTHTDLVEDIQQMTGFVSVEKYGPGRIYDGEIGKVGRVRYVASTVITPWENAGGAFNGSGTAMISTSGVNADVYPILIVGQNAYGTVAFKGADAVKVMVLNPNTPNGADPLGQRGTAGWKTYSAAVILNDLWMARVEVAAVQ